LASAGLLALLSGSAYAAPAGSSAFPDFDFDFGAGYWYSTGGNQNRLYADATKAEAVSALHYVDQRTHSGELYFEADHKSGVFIKGFVGLGGVVTANLFDEDFPPETTPYSRTLSSVSGNLQYATVDLGYTFVNTMSKSDPDKPGEQTGFKWGGFVGHNYWHELYNAYGCTQLATSDICAPAEVAPNAKAITEEDTLNSLRLGSVVDIAFAPGWKIRGDGAFIVTDQANVDTHYFTLGRIPAPGHGMGFQLEGVPTHYFNEHFSVGVGGRWWRLWSAVHLSDSGQLETYNIDSEGSFVRAGLSY